MLSKLKAIIMLRKKGFPLSDAHNIVRYITLLIQRSKLNGEITKIEKDNAEYLSASVLYNENLNNAYSVMNEIAEILNKRFEPKISPLLAKTLHLSSVLLVVICVSLLSAVSLVTFAADLPAPIITFINDNTSIKITSRTEASTALLNDIFY